MYEDTDLGLQSQIILLYICCTRYIWLLMSYYVISIESIAFNDSCVLNWANFTEHNYKFIIQNEAITKTVPCILSITFITFNKIMVNIVKISPS